MAYNNFYINNSSETATIASVMEITGNANYSSPYISFQTEIKTEKGKISAELYFTYIKRKFGTLEKMKLEGRLKRIEKAFNQAVENGQEALGNKLLNELARETRESVLYAKGIKLFIERDDLTKYKYRIKNGHISDTMLKDYTRLIPKKVLEKKEKVKDIFDDFVIWHYYNEELEKKVEKKQKITPEEKSKMKDPILFGIIKETNRLYFIADWQDEHCDLSFEEMVDLMGKDEEDITLKREPKLLNNGS